MKQIIAMGGGGFSMEPDNLLLDHYILNQSGKASPRVCFLPTASGDSATYIARFYQSLGDALEVPGIPEGLELPSLRWRGPTPPFVSEVRRFRPNLPWHSLR